MAKEQELINNRDRYIARLKEKYPDKDFADDDAVFGQINEDYDTYDKRLSEFEQNEKELTDLFNKDRRSASFLADWANGQDPIVSLIRRFGPDLVDALEDPEKVDALAKANKEFAEKVAKSQQYEEEYYKNMGETLSVIESMQKEDGLSDEQMDETMAFLVRIVGDGLMGKFSKESLQMARKALNHDGDVAMADRVGEVRGRNAKIEEKLRKNSQGDGTPNLAGKNGAAKPAQPVNDIFSLARQAR